MLTRLDGVFGPVATPPDVGGETCVPIGATNATESYEGIRTFRRVDQWLKNETPSMRLRLMLWTLR